MGTGIRRPKLGNNLNSVGCSCTSQPFDRLPYLYQLLSILLIFTSHVLQASLKIN